MRDKFKIFTLFFIYFLTISTCVTLISACSKTLSRSRAKAIIVKQLHFPQSQSFKIYFITPRQFPTKWMEKEWFSGGKETCLKYYSTENNWLEWLKSKGLIDISHVEKKARSLGEWYYWYEQHVTLTDKGKKYLIKTNNATGNLFDKSYYEVKMGDKVFEEVTGIKITGINNMAIVDYTWKYTNHSPFASLDDKETGSNVIHKSEAYLTLYDDGWRLQN